MKIAIYGGSFNPIHKGHIKLAQSAIKLLNLDEFIFVPSFKGPFKQNIQLINHEHRVNMIELILEDKMFISNFEINRKGISYTIDTIKYFKNKYPNDELFLIIGSDHLAKLNKWKNIEEISTISTIVVFKRRESISNINLKKYNCLLLNNEISIESSTRFLHGEYNDVSPKVKHYIGKNKLYFDEIVKNTLSVERYKHSLYAAKFGVDIAKHLKISAKKAYYACLMHDITKEWDENKQRSFLALFSIDESKFKNYELHQTTGSIWLQREFFVDDEEITNAIKVHTSLSLELSTMDKLVFMADKLCLGRKWEGIQKIRKMCFDNFDKAFALVVKETWEFNKNKGLTITQKQEEIYKKWSNLED